MPANGIGASTQLSRDGSVLRWDGLPSPDGNYIAHHDKDQQLWVLDVESGRMRQLSRGDRARHGAWSPRLDAVR